MKLDITSLYFKGDTVPKGDTASWGTSLGQRIGNKITVHGAQKLVDLMVSNKFEFDYNNPNHKADFEKLKLRKYPYAAIFNSIWVNNKEFVKNRFWNTFLKTANAIQKQRWQNIITESGWSSHMMVVSQKP